METKINGNLNGNLKGNQSVDRLVIQYLTQLKTGCSVLDSFYFLTREETT